MKKFIFLSLALVLMPVFGLNATGLTVSNPHSWSSPEYGTIEKASVKITPMGAFVKYNMFLEFSARDTWFSKQADSLEVNYVFDLPGKSIITDSWLWVDDTLVKADLIEKRKATMIYEDIVKRRRDPSLLTKESENSYKLLIYPMAPAKSRKVMIEFMVPADFDGVNYTASTALVNNLLNCGKAFSILKSYKLGFAGNNEFNNPVLIGDEGNYVFSADTDIDLGETQAAIISTDDTKVHSEKLNIEFDFKNDVYLSTVNFFGEDYYQLMLNLQNVTDFNNTKRRIAVIIDHTNLNTYYTYTNMLNALKSNLLENYNSSDEFNIIISNLNPKMMSNTWMKLDLNTVDSIFNVISNQTFVNYSNTPELFKQTFSYIDQTFDANTETDILTLSSSNSLADISVANQLLSDLSIQNKHKTKVYTYNYSSCYNYVNKSYYYGNEYFYINLARNSGGEILSYVYNYPHLNNLFALMQPFNESTKDLVTYMDKGIMFDRYNNFDSKLFRNGIFTEFGKFEGEFPLNALVNIKLNGKLYSKKFHINESDISAEKYNIHQPWSGYWLREQEALPSVTNAKANEIISWSRQSRVLCNLTAFLALEPSMNPNPSEDDINTDVEDATQTDFGSFSMQPNPASSNVTIKLNLNDGIDISMVDIFIYDSMGRKVKTINPLDLSGKSFNWNLIDDNGNLVPSGIYIVQINTPNGNLTMNLAVVR